MVRDSLQLFDLFVIIMAVPFMIGILATPSPGTKDPAVEFSDKSHFLALAIHFLLLGFDDDGFFYIGRYVIGTINLILALVSGVWCFYAEYVGLKVYSIFNGYMHYSYLDDRSKSYISRLTMIIHNVMEFIFGLVYAWWIVLTFCFAFGLVTDAQGRRLS